MDAGRRNGTLKALLGATTLAAVALVAMVPAFACTPTSTARISPEGGAPGISAMVTGTLFKASMGDVVVKWGGASGVPLAAAAVDAEGSFGPVEVKIPAAAEAGQLAIVAVYQPGDPSGRVSNVTFRVAGTPATAAPAPPTPAEPTPAVQQSAAAAPVPAPVVAAPAPAPAPAAIPAPQRQARAEVATGTPAAAPSPSPEAVPPALPAAVAGTAPAAVAATPSAPPLELPEITETDPAGSAAVPDRPADAPATGSGSEDGDRSLWVLVPLMALGLSLLAGGIAAVYEPRRRREAVPSLPRRRKG